MVNVDRLKVAYTKRQIASLVEFLGDEANLFNLSADELFMF
jgi:hypothetical protein